MNPAIAAIGVVLMLACGAPAVPGAELPPYTGQEQCDCRDLGFVCTPSVCTHRSAYGLRCDAFWGCNLDAQVGSCRQVCAWAVVDGGVP